MPTPATRSQRHSLAQVSRAGARLWQKLSEGRSIGVGLACARVPIGW
ncbi:MAG: hypothetical protein HC852_05410 [Acaryochloridaceae cyanobacterium RU_4_10]|nr:hypothetical protein [Acaryochloridaceae cyanobacterium RU_4_10]